MNRLRGHLGIWLFKLGLLIKSPGCTAQGFLLTAPVLNPGGNPTVLCLSRSIFNDDVAALAAARPDVRFVMLSGTRLKRLMWRCIGNDPDRDKLHENNYYTHDYCRAGLERFYRFLQALIPRLRSRWGFEAVLSGNFGYRQQQELARLCEEWKLPFVVLHKEGVFQQEHVETYKNYFVGRRFVGRKLLFYSETMRRLVLDLNLVGATEEKTAVVGIPRLDKYFTLPPAARQQIVLFSFPIGAKTGYFSGGKDVGAAMQPISDAFHTHAMQFAQKHPEYHVVIKMKVPPRHRAYITRLHAAAGIPALPNLTLTNDADPFVLIRESAAVLGFNTIGQIEAFAAKRVLISPWFGDILEAGWHFFEQCPQALTFVRTYEDMEAAILSAGENPAQGTPEGLALLDQMVYNSDGRASRRVMEIIDQLIAEFRTALRT